MEEKSVERHPLQPFMPDGARLLLLGSFPPKRERWSMEFFYPNWINDMWRIMGSIFYGDRHHFECGEGKRFDRERIVAMCRERGIALYDAATEVRRLNDNASDKFLEVVTPTDIGSMLDAMPECRAIATTGQRATEVITAYFGCEQPAIGGVVEVCHASRVINFWRMPSSSRAYPLSLDKKADYYRRMLEAESIK